MKLFTIKIEIPEMIVEALDQSLAQKLAHEHLDEHLRRNPPRPGYAYEVHPHTRLSLAEMSSTPYGAEDNRTVARIIKNASPDA